MVFLETTAEKTAAASATAKAATALARQRI